MARAAVLPRSDDLTDQQRITLGRLAFLAGEGRYYVPKGQQSRLIGRLVELGLAAPAGVGLDPATGRVGLCFRLTMRGARAAPAMNDRCALPFPWPEPP